MDSPSQMCVPKVKSQENCKNYGSLYIYQTELVTLWKI